MEDNNNDDTRQGLYDEFESEIVKARNPEAYFDESDLVEIFDYASDQPVISEEDIRGASRLIAIPLDTYSLFDRRTEGEWRIIGHQENYTPEDAENIWFSWGIGSDCKKSNVFDHTVSISEEEWKMLPPLSPSGDYKVKWEVAAKLREQ